MSAADRGDDTTAPVRRLREALPWGSPVTEFLGRCDEASAGDFTIRYLNRPDLIQMRQAIGRPKDLRRAAELQALR
jgi:hypothetical protein